MKMRMGKSSKIWALALAGALMLAGCGSASSGSESGSGESGTTGSESAVSQAAGQDAAQGEAYQIGILQLADHPALDAANQGFVEAVEQAGLTVEWDIKSAQGDQSAAQTIATKFAGDEKDMILAIATPAAQAAAGATESIPVVATAITDFVEAGLAQSKEAPGGNVTGTSDLNPIKEQMALLVKLLPQAKTVGILYSSAEVNSALQAEIAKEEIAALGLESQEFSVSSSNEIQTVVESMVGKVDVIYAPTDNLISAGMATVTMVATEHGLPVIAGEEGMLANGALATIGINYYQLGILAGEMAVEILRDGKDPAQMPIGYLPAEKLEISYNSDVAAQLGIDLSPIQ